MISLGCAKNLVDSEVMLGLLKEKGYEITPDEGQAHILIVNTCAFIEAAKQESVDAIIQLIESYKDKKIIVAGCLAQRYEEKLISEFGDNIHAVFGVDDFTNIVDVCEALLKGEKYHKVTKNPEYIYDYRTPRLRATLPHFAYVKIAEGCDNRCSYCVIPQIRGKFRSRNMDSIVAETEKLTKTGVKEVALIAQDTTFYGKDLKDGSNITELLKKLVKIQDIHWIRVLYSHPAHINDDFLELMAQEEKICSYIDIPVQHIHDDILKKMGRNTSQSQIYHLIEKIRNTIPDVTLRTSLIVGFPGETKAHFKALLKFVEDAQFDHLGVFTYSPEDGTKAFNMKSQISESVKQERMNQIAQLHEKIAIQKRKQLIGKERLVLVDSGGFQAKGRMESQAAEIDDVVHITDTNIKPGEFVKVKIIDIHESFDLIGSIIK